MMPTVTAFFAPYAIVDRVLDLKILIFDFLGVGQEDPYVIVPSNDNDVFRTEYGK